EGVVDDHRYALLRVHHGGAGQPGDDRQLLPGAGGQLGEGHGDAVQGAGGDRQVVIDVHVEPAAVDDPAQGQDLVAERAHVPGAGGVPGPVQALVQQCAGACPPLQVLQLGAGGLAGGQRLVVV